MNGSHQSWYPGEEDGLEDVENLAGSGGGKRAAPAGAAAAAAAPAAKRSRKEGGQQLLGMLAQLVQQNQQLIKKQNQQEQQQQQQPTQEQSLKLLFQGIQMGQQMAGQGQQQQQQQQQQQPQQQYTPPGTPEQAGGGGFFPTAPPGWGGGGGSGGRGGGDGGAGSGALVPYDAPYPMPPAPAPPPNPLVAMQQMMQQAQGMGMIPAPQPMMQPQQLMMGMMQQMLQAAARGGGGGGVWPPLPPGPPPAFATDGTGLMSGGSRRGDGGILQPGFARGGDRGDRGDGGGRRRRGGGGDRRPRAPREDDSDRPAGCCLLVVMRDAPPSFQPRADDLYWLFSQFGPVEKLSLFKKDGVKPPQALVQLAEPRPAVRAKGYLNGRGVLLEGRSGGTEEATLAVIQSSHKQLNFSTPDDCNRDYRDLNDAARKAIDDSSAGEFLRDRAPAGQDFLWENNVGSGGGWLRPRQPEAHQGQVIIEEKAGPPEGKVGDCILVSGTPVAADVERHCPRAGAGAASAASLVGLFGLYGEVVAVKLLQKFDDRALVQFSCRDEAELACRRLHGAQLFGKSWDVKPSKHANATNWSGARTGLEAKMCVRGTGPGERLSPPRLAGVTSGEVGNEVVWWGLPASASDDAVRTAITEAGAEVTDVGASELAADHGAAKRVSCASREDAFVAVCRLNGGAVWLGGEELTVRLTFPHPEF